MFSCRILCTTFLKFIINSHTCILLQYSINIKMSGFDVFERNQRQFGTETFELVFHFLTFLDLNWTYIYLIHIEMIQFLFFQKFGNFIRSIKIKLYNKLFYCVDFSLIPIFSWFKMRRENSQLQIGIPFKRFNFIWEF